MLRLSDDDALILLKLALAALGEKSGESARSDTAMTSARTALAGLVLELTGAVRTDTERDRAFMEVHPDDEQ